MPEKYIAQQGDCIHSIAFERGFFPDTVWKDAANAELKQKRKHPHLLMAGDIVTIPDKRMKEVAKPAEKKHCFRRKGVPKEFKVQLLRGKDPMANVRCLLAVDDEARDVTTDGDGWLKVMIPPNAQVATVRLPDGRDFHFHLGQLDPVEEISGVQGRLLSLGYYSGPVDGEMNGDVTDAIKRFQHNNGLNVTGQLDAPTRDALVQLAGS